MEICPFCYFQYLPESLDPGGNMSASRKHCLDFYVVSNDLIELESRSFGLNFDPSSVLKMRKSICDCANDRVAFHNPVS